MSLLDDYSWLHKRLNRAFGSHNVRPEMADSGNTLLFYFGPLTAQGVVLAERRMGKLINDEYEVLEVTNGMFAPAWSIEEYSLNAESDRAEAIEEMIELSVVKIKELNETNRR